MKLPNAIILQRTIGLDGYEYEWTITDNDKLYARRTGTNHWTLAAVNMTAWEQARDYVYGYCQHEYILEVTR